MPDHDPPARPPVIGLVVNPIAGLGGSVGLKGTDGAEIVARALAMGAQPRASSRAADALIALHNAWPPSREPPVIVTGDGSLGMSAASSAGCEATVIGEPVAGPTSADDTRHLAASFVAEAVNLLLFAGGDGTARDILAAVGGETTVLGIPAGVKVQSAVFATSPVAAGRLAAAFLATDARRTSEREVLDLDEAAYRRGEVAPRLHGFLHVPVDRRVQSRKTQSPLGEAAAMRAIAAEVVDAMVLDRRYVLGPGTTVRSIADALGVDKALVGVDVIELTPDGARLVAGDAGDREVRGAVSSGAISIVVTPIGGQGFLFGRGNQQISPAALRQAGRDGIIVVATPSKLAALGGRPLLVDTGDPALDRDLAGHLAVVTGYRERTVVRVEPA